MSNLTGTRAYQYLQNLFYVVGKVVHFSIFVLWKGWHPCSPREAFIHLLALLRITVGPHGHISCTLLSIAQPLTCSTGLFWRIWALNCSTVHLDTQSSSRPLFYSFSYSGTALFCHAWSPSLSVGLWRESLDFYTVLRKVAIQQKDESRSENEHRDGVIGACSPHVRESGIRNPANICCWNPESRD